VSFIQDNVVYRLVWAVEAARLHLEYLGAADGEPPGGTLALCLTYGVPNATAALFMQAGLRSRPQAVRAVEKAGMSFADMRQLREWVRRLRRQEIEPIAWETASEQAEWDRFLARFDHRYITAWREIETVLTIEWAVNNPPKENTRVRVDRIPGATRAIVSSVSALPLGETTIPREIRSDFFFGLVREDTTSITVSFFGP
jgi:hypothetical protein